jgi:hypothetical protein
METGQAQSAATRPKLPPPRFSHEYVVKGLGVTKMARRSRKRPAA